MKHKLSKRFIYRQLLASSGVEGMSLFNGKFILLLFSVIF